MAENMRGFVYAYDANGEIHTRAFRIYTGGRLVHQMRWVCKCGESSFWSAHDLERCQASLAAHTDSHLSPDSESKI
jgi:hypothetical protein